MLLPALDDGRWDDCVRLADAFIAECEAGHRTPPQASVHCHRGSIRLARDEHRRVRLATRSALSSSCAMSRQPDRVFQALAFAARAFAESRRGSNAHAGHASTSTSCRSVAGAEPPSWSYIHFALVAAGASATPRSWIGCWRVRGGRPRGIVVTRAVVRGEYAEAAEVFAQMGTRPHEAYARLRAAETLVADGRRAEADEQLAKALAFFRSVGATRYVREAEALLSAPVEKRA